MNKIVLLLLISMAVVFVSGCTGDKTKTEIKTSDGTVKITGDAGSDSWCPEGGNWEMTSTSMDASATWKIDKLVTSGKYAGLCHVIYTAKGPEEVSKIDYYFDESGKNGYIEMEINGQKMSQEWHG
jgi:hypothetical protein